jgi:nucleoside-diphosphate-sugar epimerase
MSTSLSRVLVTGANGFIGTALCEVLERHGHGVIAVVRPSSLFKTSTPQNVVRLELMQNEAQWLATMESVDCVVHLAAHVHRMNELADQISRYRAVNSQGAGFVAERAAAAHVKRFVLLSTIKVNGEGGENVRYGPASQPCPQDEYGKSKLEAENSVRQICDEAGMQYVCIRPPLVYGPGAPANFSRLMWLASLGIPLPLKSVRNKRSFVGVQNLVALIETCILHEAAAGGTWLVSDGEDVSTPDLLRRLAKHLKRPVRLFSCPPPALRMVGNALGKRAEVDRLCDSLQIDISSTTALLNWQPPVSLDGELAITAASYLTGNNLGRRTGYSSEK